MKPIIRILFLLITPILVFTQSASKHYKISIVAFYNLENFYDTTNNPIINDDDFTLKGIKHYNSIIYQDKINNLAKVIGLIGIDYSTDGPAILGVAEIENDTVLNDLIHHPLLKKRNYQLVHFDSKDIRGIDVALLYNPSYFTVLESGKLHVSLPYSRNEKYETRDVLWVKGLMDGEAVYFMVTHWPSKRGGEDRTNASRASAAAVCRNYINSIFKKEPGAKIILMGDLNDNPDSYSVTKVLQTSSEPNKTSNTNMYNPWALIYKNGYGTLANQDTWSLFDQLLLSKAWLTKEQRGFYLNQYHIFKKLFMVENTGRYKGYPMRTWDGNNYRGGFSDHFPTYLVLIKNL